MVVFPKAKINIGLQITGKRTDGYHDIETLFYPIDLCDALECVVSSDRNKKDHLTVTGIKTESNIEDNIISKAIRVLRKRYEFPPLKIHLHKAIPVGAGLGGGSSDAAALLKLINRCFRLTIENSDLKAVALELGSDCPFFIDNIPSFGSGRGEILQPVNLVLAGYYFLLLNPGISINTREAYENCTPASPSSTLLELADRPVADWKDLIINDFENFVFKTHPLIGEIKDNLYRSGAVFSSMSGSGSSVYGLFSKRPNLTENLKEYAIYESYL